jgi:acetylornithine deacetylase/succinyl-diaminopimelate desuccinylase-like protein
MEVKVWSNWLTSKKPCIVYGQRGICYFTLEVSGLSRNVCSKKYGGGIHEPMFDVLYMMDALQDKDGKIIIPGVMDDVLAPTKADQEALEKITVDVNEIRSLIGSRRLAHAEKGSRILMHRWHLPALVLHGIEGGYSGKGDREIIPGKVTGKFSIQIVENQVRL